MTRAGPSREGVHRVSHSTLPAVPLNPIPKLDSSQCHYLSSHRWVGLWKSNFAEFEFDFGIGIENAPLTEARVSSTLGSGLNALAQASVGLCVVAGNPESRSSAGHALSQSRCYRESRYLVARDMRKALGSVGFPAPCKDSPVSSSGIPARPTAGRHLLPHGRPPPPARPASPARRPPPPS